MRYDRTVVGYHGCDTETAERLIRGEPFERSQNDYDWLGKMGNKVEIEQKPKMTWYQTTRRSFVTRHLSRGASLDEVSAAVGHSSPIVTKRYYGHYVRRSFSPKRRAGLGLGARKADCVVPMREAAGSGGG